MCRRCEPNHKVDIPVCTAGIGMVVGAGWNFAHSYEGQPFIEALVPWLIITGMFAVVGVIIGLILWRLEI